jgi:hypothetical protein
MTHSGKTLDSPALEQRLLGASGLLGSLLNVFA